MIRRATPGQECYEDYVADYYRRFPLAPGDAPCPPWAEIAPEFQDKWEVLAADLEDADAVASQPSLFEDI